MREFSDYYEALAATRPDVVSINTYPETHAPYARAALDAGCHVFCEKPLAETVAEAQTIVDAARARRRKLVIGYILRVHPAWMKF
ncbi:Gfo/Idh/MocA family protein, partial [Streptomyces brasiliscabiei]|uniref:Gfo/Idh/MocA family protein n=1 Tax=Streptomyces brasiliscabiei TaxID=2736302 RepID=UPI0030154154